MRTAGPGSGRSVRPSLIARRSPSSPPAMQVGRRRRIGNAITIAQRVDVCTRTLGAVEKEHVVDTTMQALFWDTTAAPVSVCNEEPCKNGSQKGILMCWQDCQCKFGGSERDGGLRFLHEHDQRLLFVCSF